jgi:hypothetical protein
LKNYEAFKNELQQHPDVKRVTYSSDIPTYTVHSFGGFEWEGKNPNDEIVLHSFSVGDDYVETLGLELVDGRDFVSGSPADSSNYILNEEAVKLTGLKSPVGQRFSMWGREGKIVGIVKDFNFKSLHQKVEPLVLRTNPAWNDYLMIRLSGADTKQSLETVGAAWKKYNPDYPFEYQFVDQQYETLYKSEQRMARVFNYFTSFTLFISCLGLIGLINHMIEKRKKEISIRKVLGASVSGILMLLSREYLRLIALAILISTPIAAYIVYSWLENYAYKIETQWWMYALPGLLVILVVLLLVFGQTLKTARQNPVENLRYE